MNATRFTNGFSEKIIFWGLKMTHFHNFGSALSFFIEILHNERGQEVHENYIKGFCENYVKGFCEKNVILAPKMMHPHNSGSTLRIFFKFRIMKGAERYMELILMVFLKKFSFRANGPFWP